MSRYLANLRIERELKPGQLASILQARNISKIGSLIRQFELNGEISSYWMEKLITEFVVEHKLDAQFVQQMEGLTYVRFVVEEDEDNE